MRWLNECIDKENSIACASAVNVRVNSYTTYDSKKGINVVVKLYVPTGGTQPKFTGMTGTVTVNMNKKNTVKNFSNFINCYNWKYEEKHNRFKSEARNYAENCKYQHEKMP